MERVFEEDLKYSIDGFDGRKKFYNSIGITEVEFVNFDTEEDKALQRHDIDVVGRENGGDCIGISEKIRNRKYSGDILIEVFSIYEKNIFGWMKDTKAKYLVCFFLDRIIVLDVKTLKEYLHKFVVERRDFTPSVKKTADRLISSGKQFGKLDNFNDIFVAIADNKTYHTVSVVIKTEQFKNNGVKIWEYA